ncbi:MAG: hypothetical protein KAU24_04460, partial [Candidatus Aenigmarchaeota archaeon]|nr:hypothetical protein [Candidatus Aenigmarchaeota archaeon]
MEKGIKFLILITFFAVGSIGLGVFFVSGVAPPNGDGPINGGTCVYECDTDPDCGAGYVCEFYDCIDDFGFPDMEGVCVSCDLCSPSGARRCSGNNVQECQDVSGCLEWVTIQTCGAGYRCQGAQCVVDPGTCSCMGCELAGGRCRTWLTADNCNTGEGYYPVCDETDCITRCIDGDDILACYCEEIPPCRGRPCGTTCPDTGVGICDGYEYCYPNGECSLTCSVPDPGPGNERVWNNPGCGRTGSYKLNNALICSASVTSCGVGGTPISVNLPNQFTYRERPEYNGVHWPFYTEGDIVPIELSFIGNPGSFTRLSECKLI